MKKFIAFTCMTAMMISTSFAQIFSDLPDTHWAQKVVEEMAEQKIISGYTDGTFKPAKNISKIESIILLARIAGINKYTDAANEYLKTYESTLSKYTTQYKKDVAYLLGTKVLEIGDLDNLLLADQVNAPITREEMAILITKVMGKNDEVKSKSLIILSFADKDSISPNARPYVYYVSSEKIMGGVDSKNFSPKTHVTRAQAASILQRIYKKVDIKPETSTSTNTNTTPTPNPNDNTSSGQVSGNLVVLNGEITKVDTSLQTVFVKDTSGKTEEYEYDSSTEFYVNSVKKTAAEIAKGLTVTITVKDNSYITLMRITKDTKETITGTISSFDTAKKTITVSKKTYTYNSSTKFYLNDKSSTALKALKKNYEVTLTIEENIVNKVESKEVKDEETITGKITKASEDKGYIVIQDDDGEKYTLRDNYIDEYEEDDEDYYFDEDVKYYYNGSSEKYNNIADKDYIYKKGYYVRITADTKGTISKFELASKESKLDEEDDDNEKTTDKIIGKIIDTDKDDGYIVIENSDGDEFILMDDYLDEYDDGDEDYYFDKNTTFSYNAVSKTYSSASTTSYLYKEGLYARITLDDDDYIEKFELAAKESAFKSSSSSSSSSDIDSGYMFGCIVDMDSDEIVIEDDDGEEYEFKVSENAIIIEKSSSDPEGDLYYYDEEYDEILSEGDDVMVFVYKEKSSTYYTSLIVLFD